MIPFDQIKSWIFDMDGTLTMAIHNFDEIRSDLDLPEKCDILAEIEKKSSKEQQEYLRKKLNAIELQLAKNARRQEGIIELLTLLKKRKCNVGIITRNNKLNTIETLKAAQLDVFFAIENILTRECAAPKPSPEAIVKLLDQWNSLPSETVMIGDYIHDINAGIAAHTYTIYFDGKRNDAWSHAADLTIKNWKELLPNLQ